MYSMFPNLSSVLPGVELIVILVVAYLAALAVAGVVVGCRHLIHRGRTLTTAPTGITHGAS